MESYDGSDAIERAWRDGLKPDPLLTVSQWADRYRVLSQRASSEPGRWRTARTPYLKEIMDCLSPSSPYQRVAFMKGAQIGGSECGNNFLAFVIHQAPGPMMAVAPTVELAKRNSKQRIDPLIEESEVLRERVKERRSRDSGNYGEEYFRQLTAERLVTRIVKGFPRGSWEKEPGRRNEALDCRVYARVAAAIYGLDRFEERHWRRMEEALARTVEGDDHEPASPRAPVVRPPARQVIHSGYMAR